MDSYSHASRLTPPPADAPAGPPGPEAAPSPTGQSFDVRTPPPEGETYLGWPKPVSAQVGPYQLLEEIAQGGMGVVYKALDTRLGRVVALKTLRPDAVRRPGALPRFQREMQAAARLSHPNIVPIHDVGTHDGQPFYTMAYVTGGSLAQHRQRLLQEPRTVAALVEKIARGVQHAHERQVFHRDLKPANILMDDHGRPQISDFGLAKLRDSDLELTQTGAVVGTVPYLSPEQAAGRGREIGASTDVWAVGVILYELLTGRQPFTGDGSDEVRRKILAEEPPRPTKLRPGLDRDLETILSTCLDKDPALRYPTAAALADDLRRYLRGEPVRPTGRGARLIRTARRYAWAAVLVAAAGVTAAAALLYREYTDPDRPLRAYPRRWAAGQSLTLVDDQGRSPWSRWVLLPGQSYESAAQHGLVLKSMEDLSLLELLPAPPAEGYRLRARVKHWQPGGQDPNAASGLVGLYFGRSQSAGPDGTTQALCTLWFSDRANWNNRVELAVWRWLDRDSSYNTLRRHLIFDARFAARIVGLTGTPAAGALDAGSSLLPAGLAGSYPNEVWRELAVEATPERYRVFWLNEMIADVTPATLQATFAGLPDPRDPSRQPPAFQPPFAPAGGLGLCVSRGAVFFRDVIIEPLEKGEGNQRRLHGG